MKKILRKIGVSQFFNGLIQFILILTGYIPSGILRKLIYKYIFRMKIGSYSRIHHGAKLRAPWNISIGKNTIIGDNAILDGRNGLVIGDNVNFSTGVWVWTMQHDMNSKEFKASGGPVVIEDYVWVSCRTTILPDVKIGEGAVLAANSVVTKSVLQYSVMGGVPAKKIGERSKDLKYTLRSRIPFI